jgi:hypothetical protein
VQNLSWLLAGIYASKSVHLSKVASKIPGKTLLVSIPGGWTVFWRTRNFGCGIGTNRS